MSSNGAPRTVDSRVTPLPWHFLQSPFWAAHKAAFGWRPITIPGNDIMSGLPDVLALTRRIAGGMLLTYVPYAPAIAGEPMPEPGTADLAPALVRATSRIRDEVTSTFGRPPWLVRFDLPQVAGREDFISAYEAIRGSDPPLRKAPVDVQPPDTVVIDLRDDEQEIIAGMHKKNRYNIRLAERKGVKVDEAEPARIACWYELYRETAKRDRISIHSRAYYERLFELSEEPDAPRLRLYLASHEAEILAGIIVVYYAGGATYLYGASSNEKRSLMPNYALQWRAIVDARRSGCAWYDMFGVPPADDPSHPMHGLYRFKTGFGGTLIHRLGCWDSLLRPAGAGLFRTMERARNFYVRRVRHPV